MHSQRQVFSSPTKEKISLFWAIVCAHGSESSYAYSSSKHTTIPHGFLWRSPRSNTREWLMGSCLSIKIRCDSLPLTKSYEIVRAWEPLEPNKKLGLSERASLNIIFTIRYPPTFSRSNEFDHCCDTGGYKIVHIMVWLPDSFGQWFECLDSSWGPVRVWLNAKECIKREETTRESPLLPLKTHSFESCDVGTVSPLIEPLEVF